jgi:hypothetical protein
MYDAEKAQMDIFRGAAVLAPEFKELEKEREVRRHTRQELTIKAMAKEKSLAIGLSVAKARDILWAFTGRDMYRMFVVEQRWTSEEYEEWLAQLLALLRNSSHSRNTPFPPAPVSCLACSFSASQAPSSD